MKLPSLLSCLLAAAVVAAGVSVPSARAAEPREYYVFFGTYSRGASKGIYRAKFDPATGRLSAAELAAESPDPSFLALHPNGRFLYAVEENADTRRTPGRGVSAFALDPATGSLRHLNYQSASGASPCHIAVDPAGKTVLVANYNSGSIAAIKLEPDGRLGAMGSEIQHEGSSVNRGRQAGPHAHGVTLSPDARLVFVPDLGLDKVMAYRLDPAAATLTPHTVPFASVAPGSGPRHIAFHPNGRLAYVINEMLCTITAFRYDAAAGALQEIETVSSLPEGTAVARGMSTAEILVHPGGKFVYGSNRGHNSLGVFAVAADTGKLTQIQNQPTLGRTPRHFTFDPTGRWLMVENQDTGNVAVFAVDPATGKLADTGQNVAVPNAVCAVFVPVR
jgi:6-phosphogluconolactonase